MNQLIKEGYKRQDLFILKNYLNTLGFCVDLSFKTDEKFDYSLSKKCIKIKTNTIDNLLRNLLFCSANVLMEMRSKNYESHNFEHYEYLYGWYIAKYLNLSITKTDWKQYCLLK